MVESNCFCKQRRNSPWQDSCMLLIGSHHLSWWQHEFWLAHNKGRNVVLDVWRIVQDKSSSELWFLFISVRDIYSTTSWSNFFQTTMSEWVFSDYELRILDGRYSIMRYTTWSQSSMVPPSPAQLGWDTTNLIRFRAESKVTQNQPSLRKAPTFVAKRLSLEFRGSHLLYIYM